MHSPEAPNNHTDWDEQQLVEGIAAKKPGARVALVSASHDAVFSFACRLAPDEDLRRDWTHDCLLRIISDIETGVFQYRHPGGFWSWFRKRSWFLMLEARRSHRRRTEREPQADASLFENPGADCPQKDLENSEIILAIEACIDGIDHEDHRNALRLILLRDYTYLETAEALDSPLNTVRAWIRRGRFSLRRCLLRRLGINPLEDGS